MNFSNRVLPIIVIAQFSCISLWFASNAVMSELINSFELGTQALAHLTSAVQFGFIIGTLIFALFTIADRFSPSQVFMFSALFGATFNLGIIWGDNTLISLLIFRFATGFFLAGIYPVGMKIAADYFDKGLGKSLGYLVGALVLGTAFPHLIKDFLRDFAWQNVIIATSILATFGGLLLWILIPDGPNRIASTKPDPTAFLKVFKNKNLRAAAFGYFGHMWELYAFWTFVPLMLGTYNLLHPSANFNIPLLTFVVIGIGSFACIIGGYISISLGTKRTAFIALLLSMICCLISPLAFMINSNSFFLVFLLFWGIMVIADSPLFSTLVAQNVIGESKATALTIVNCVGFSITILSIQLISTLLPVINHQYLYVLLSIGPAAGLIALYNKTKTK